MASIYISYQRADEVFARDLAKRLATLGHTLSYDLDSLVAGTDWRATLTHRLKAAEIFIVVISKHTENSKYVLTEVGAARAYASETGRMLIIPVIIDNTPPPLALQDIHAIIQPNQDLDAICGQVTTAVQAFSERRKELEKEAEQVATALKINAADYIKVAIDSLKTLERRDRWLGYGWYCIGFLSLIAGIGFGIYNLTHIDQQAQILLTVLILITLKALLVIGLLGACAKYAFTLGKSYASEALKCSDRIHAIRFGDFYLNAFGAKTQWSELKEVFQHWNIDRSSSFASLDTSSFDPKFVESFVEFAKLFPNKGAGKQS